MSQVKLDIDIKQKALDKMLEEMNEKHTPTEDIIHNWICDQEDEELFKGILKEGKTINGAVKYCAAQAQKQKTGNMAMIDDATVFSWIRKYFVSGKVKEEKVDARVEVSTEPKEDKITATNSRKRRPDPRDKKQKSKDEELQLSLFDSL